MYIPALLPIRTSKHCILPFKIGLTSAQEAFSNRNSFPIISQISKMLIHTYIQSVTIAASSYHVEAIRAALFILLTWNEATTQVGFRSRLHVCIYVCMCMCRKHICIGTHAYSYIFLYVRKHSCGQDTNIRHPQWLGSQRSVG